MRIEYLYLKRWNLMFLTRWSIRCDGILIDGDVSYGFRVLDEFWEGSRSSIFCFSQVFLERMKCFVGWISANFIQMSWMMWRSGDFFGYPIFMKLFQPRGNNWSTKTLNKIMNLKLKLISKFFQSKSTCPWII